MSLAEFWIHFEIIFIPSSTFFNQAFLELWFFQDGFGVRNRRSVVILLFHLSMSFLLRNKPIHRAATTPMGFFEGFLVCTAMMSDSSLVTAAGRRSLKKRLDGLNKKIQSSCSGIILYIIAVSSHVQNNPSYNAYLRHISTPAQRIRYETQFLQIF